MSDSGSDGIASQYTNGEGGDHGGQKKGFFYKFTALQRRTMHRLQKMSGTVDETKDDEYGTLFKNFERVEEKTTRLSASFDRFAAAQKELYAAGLELSEIMEEFYDSPSPLQPVCGMLKEAYSYMNNQIRPLLESQWEQHVKRVAETLQERFKSIRADDARRTRYVADFDYYRNRHKHLEDELKRDGSNTAKLAERVKENEHQLRMAAERYDTMHERLRTRMRIADEHKGTFLNSALIAALHIQSELYTQGSTEIGKLNRMCQDPQLLRQVAERGEELAAWDNSSKKMAPSVSNLFTPRTWRTASAPDMGARGRAPIRGGGGGGVRSSSTPRKGAQTPDRRPQDVSALPMNERPLTELEEQQIMAEKMHRQQQAILMQQQHAMLQLHDMKYKQDLPPIPASEEGASLRSQVTGTQESSDAGGGRDSGSSFHGVLSLEFKGKKMVTALYSYEATADTELDMNEGDVILVLKEDDSGWWQGEIDGRIGWFPQNFVEVVEH